MSTNILKAIAVTAELTGTELSPTAIKTMESVLSQYQEEAVKKSLKKCAMELKSRLTLADIIERIERSDGRPSADEAWAIAIKAEDEAQTIVWTDEMAMAFETARPLLEARDKVAARMAFKDAYDRIVQQARDEGRPCRWQVSLGHDASMREPAIRAAVDAGRLPRSEAVRYLPASVDADAPILEDKSDAGNREIARQKLAEIKDFLARRKAMQ